MTHVGHAITGATLGLLATPRGSSLKTTAVYMASFAVLGNLPDVSLPHWGHDKYFFSHSIFVNLSIILPIGAVLLCWSRARRFVGGPSVILLGAAAWLSHLLLDSFYNHGTGIAIFWPLSSARLILPMPWFSTLRKPWWWFESRAVRIMGIELAFYGTLFLLVAALRFGWLKYVRPERSGNATDNYNLQPQDFKKP